MCLNEMRLEFCPGILLIRLGIPGLVVLLKLTCFRNKAICNVHNLYFRDRIACRGCVVNALVEPCIEDLGRLVGVERSPQLGVVLQEVYGRDPFILAI